MNYLHWFTCICKDGRNILRNLEIFFIRVTHAAAIVNTLTEICLMLYHIAISFEVWYNVILAIMESPRVSSMLNSCLYSCMCLYHCIYLQIMCLSSWVVWLTGFWNKTTWYSCLSNISFLCCHKALIFSHSHFFIGNWSTIWQKYFHLCQFVLTLLGATLSMMHN